MKNAFFTPSFWDIIMKVIIITNSRIIGESVIIIIYRGRGDHISTGIFAPKRAAGNVRKKKRNQKVSTDCDYLQGFYYARVLPFDEAMKFLNRQTETTDN